MIVEIVSKLAPSIRHLPTANYVVSHDRTRCIRDDVVLLGTAGLIPFLFGGTAFLQFSTRNPNLSLVQARTKFTSTQLRHLVRVFALREKHVSSFPAPEVPGVISERFQTYQAHSSVSLPGSRFKQSYYILGSNTTNYRKCCRRV